MPLDHKGLIFSFHCDVCADDDSVIHLAAHNFLRHKGRKENDAVLLIYSRINPFSKS